MAIVNDLRVIQIAPTQAALIWIGTDGYRASVFVDGVAIASNIEFSSIARGYLVGLNTSRANAYEVHEYDEDTLAPESNTERRSRHIWPVHRWLPSRDDDTASYVIATRTGGTGDLSSADTVTHTAGVDYYNWTPTEALASGWHGIRVQAADIGGNESSDSAVDVYVLDYQDEVSGMTVGDGDTMVDESGNILIDESGNTLIAGLTITIET